MMQGRGSAVAGWFPCLVAAICAACSSKSEAVLASGLDCPQALAVTTDSVFWITAPSGNTELPTSTIAKVPAAGGSVSPVASDDHTPKAIAADTSDLYWTDEGDSPPGGVVR